MIEIPLDLVAEVTLPKPFFRADRRQWYVQLDGKQLNLGPDRDKAFEQYYALMNRPALILADEPTGNLDEQTGDSVMELLLGVRGEKAS